MSGILGKHWIQEVNHSLYNRVVISSTNIFRQSALFWPALVIELSPLFDISRPNRIKQHVHLQSMILDYYSNPDHVGHSR